MEHIRSMKTSFYLTSGLLDRLSKAAEKKLTSMSAIVRDALLDWLKKHGF